MNTKVYTHEFIDIIGPNRPKYVHHMTANWSPIAQAERNQLCFGVWGTIGTTGRWPQVVNLWEEDGFDGLAAGLGHETGRPTFQDPKLEKWWLEASKYRSGGLDRVIIPASGFYEFTGTKSPKNKWLFTDAPEKELIKPLPGRRVEREALSARQG